MSSTPASDLTLPKKFARILGVPQLDALNSKYFLPSAPPHGSLQKSPTLARTTSRVSARALEQTTAWQGEGMFSSMAKQQRKKPLIRLSTSAVTPSSSKNAQPSSKPKRTSADQQESPKTPTTARSSSTSKLRLTRKSIISLPRPQPKEIPVLSSSPVPSLVNDSDEPSSTSGSPIPGGRNQDYGRNIQFRSSHDSDMSDFDLHAPEDMPKDVNPEVFKLRNWFFSLAKAEDEARHFGIKNPQMSTTFNYPCSALERNSMEFDTVGYEFDVNGQSPPQFQALLVPKHYSNEYLRGVAELRDFDSPSTSPGTRSSERQEHKPSQARSSSEQLPARDCNAQITFKDHKLRQETLDHKRECEQELSLVHPAMRDQYLSQGLQRRLSSISTASTLQSPVDSDPRLKLRKDLDSAPSAVPEPVSTEQNQAIPRPPKQDSADSEVKEGREQTMTVSKEEAALLESMRHARNSMQRQLIQQGHLKPASIQTEQQPRRRTRSERETRYSQRLSVIAAAEMQEAIRQHGTTEPADPESERNQVIPDKTEVVEHQVRKQSSLTSIIAAYQSMEPTLDIEQLRNSHHLRTVSLPAPKGDKASRASKSKGKTHKARKSEPKNLCAYRNKPLPPPPAYSRRTPPPMLNLTPPSTLQSQLQPQQEPQQDRYQELQPEAQPSTAELDFIPLPESFMPAVAPPLPAKSPRRHLSISLPSPPPAIPSLPATILALRSKSPCSVSSGSEGDRTSMWSCMPSPLHLSKDPTRMDEICI